MSEIDVTYCAFARLNDVCANPINTQECKCSKISIQNCYYKQLQQIKAENEELKEIRENLHKCNKKIMDEKHNIAIKNIKYKQCLHDIEEYVDNFCENVCPYYVDEGESCDNCMVGDIVQPIKEKIKEVKSNE